jgi:hypothetical protein
MSQSGGSSSDDFDAADDVDPAIVYTLEDFLAEQEFLDSIGRQIAGKLKAKLEEQSAESSRRRSGPGRHKRRQPSPALYMPFSILNCKPKNNTVL